MSVPGPVLGPCVAWINGDDVAACCPGSASVAPDLLEVAAVEASIVLYQVSGRIFSGLCEQTVRPCADGCSCWSEWESAESCGERCGCSPLSRVRLSGYPVREIVEVKIDGDVLLSGHYRLDGYRWLTRMAEPGPPVKSLRWPGCQNLALEDTEPGTFSVRYSFGVDPPEIGRLAAGELACQIFRACNGMDCKLPTGATKVTRQGVTIDRAVLTNWFDPTKATGLVNTDMFLRAFWPTRSGRRPAVWSPDVQPFAKRLG